MDVYGKGIWIFFVIIFWNWGILTKRVFWKGGGLFLFFGSLSGGPSVFGKGWGRLAPGGSGRGPSVLQLVGQVKNKNIKT